MNRNAILILLALAPACGAADSPQAPQYTAEGQLLAPKDYREWIFLSSGLGMTYGPAAPADQSQPRFDNVFVKPASYRAFLDTGRWPDKTMFVLEIRNAAEKGSINNGGHYQTGVSRVEAAVKDETRFPQKWAYFSFNAEGKASAFPANSVCNTCHGKNAAVDNTFVQFYPTLLEVATRKGTLK